MEWARNYLGLRSYSEADRDRFFGRDAEAEQLVRNVVARRLTLLYGRSGIGKSSLIYAGLLPRIRERRLLPVSIRLGLRSGPIEAFDDRAYAITREAIQTAVADASLSASDWDEDESLWEYLHRLPVWDAQSRPVIPLLVFDQFEEILGENEAELRSSRYFQDVADLAENRVPATVRSRLAAGSARLPATGSMQVAKVLLSIREDCLSQMDGIANMLPGYLDAAVRLEPMSGSNAMEVVQQPLAGTTPVDDETAEQIVRFADGREDRTIDVADLRVEPLIVSLTCSELERRSGPDGPLRFDLELVERHELLRSFYESCFERLDEDRAERARRFVERALVTQGGKRVVCDEGSASTEYGVDRETLDRLIEAHLLRRTHWGSVSYVEVIHDRLAEVIAHDRDRREAAEAVRVAAAKRATRLRRLLAIASVGALVLVVVGGVLMWMYQDARDAEEAERKAAGELRIAIKDAEVARDAARDAAEKELAANKKLRERQAQLDESKLALADKNLELKGKNEELEGKRLELEGKNKELQEKRAELEDINKQLGESLREEEKAKAEAEALAARLETSIKDVQVLGLVNATWGARGEDGALALELARTAAERSEDPMVVSTLHAALLGCHERLLVRDVVDAVFVGDTSDSILTLTSDGVITQWSIDGGIVARFDAPEPIADTTYENLKHAGDVVAIQRTNVMSGRGIAIVIRKMDGSDVDEIAYEGAGWSLSPDGKQLLVLTSEGETVDDGYVNTYKATVWEDGQVVEALTRESPRGGAPMVGFTPSGVPYLVQPNLNSSWETTSLSLLRPHPDELEVGVAPDDTYRILESGHLLIEGKNRLELFDLGNWANTSWETREEIVQTAGADAAQGLLVQFKTGAIFRWKPDTGERFDVGLRQYTDESTSFLRGTEVRFIEEEIRLIKPSGSLIRLVRAAEESEDVELRGHTSWVRASFSRDGTRILSVGQAVRVWDVVAGSPGAIGPPGVEVRRMALAPDGTTVALLTEDGAEIWSVKGTRLAALESKNGRITDLTYHPAMNVVVTCTERGYVELWKGDGRKIRGELRHRGAGLNHVDVSASGEVIMATGPRGGVLLLSMKDVREANSLVGVTPTVLDARPAQDRIRRGAYLSPDGTYVVAVDGPFDKEDPSATFSILRPDAEPVVVHDDMVQSRRPSFALDGSEFSIRGMEAVHRISRDGEKLSDVKAGESIVTAWYTTDGIRVLGGDLGATTLLLVDQEGQALGSVRAPRAFAAEGGHSQEMSVPDPCAAPGGELDADTAVREALFGPADGAGVGVSPDGQRVLSASVEGALLLSDGNGRPLLTIPGGSAHCGGVPFIEVSENHAIGAILHGGEVRLFHLKTDALVEAAKTYNNRALTDAERERFHDLLETDARGK